MNNRQPEADGSLPLLASGGRPPENFGGGMNMNKWLCCAVLFLWTVGNAATGSAMALINANAIREAQEYGRAHAHLEFQQFLQPWRGTQAKAAVAGLEEQAYLYTPFLVIAADARERTLNGQAALTLADSEQALSDYNGTLSVSIVVFGATDGSFKQQPKISLQQEKRSVKPYRIVWPESGLPQVSLHGKSYLKAHCYAYFSQQDVKEAESAQLVLLAADGREHSFSFDLLRMK